MDIQNLWESYTLNRSIDLRNKIIEYYMYVADKVSFYMHNQVEKKHKEEIKSLAYIGLIDAVEKFNINLNVKFQTYAIIRIKGTIRDEIRKLGYFSQYFERKKERFRKYNKLYYQKYNKLPDNSKDLKKLFKISNDQARYFDNFFKYNCVQQELTGNIICDYNLEKDVINKLDVEKLNKITSKLNDDEKKFFNLYYYENLTLKKIAEIYNRTESRMSQVKTKLELKIKNEFFKK